MRERGLPRELEIYSNRMQGTIEEEGSLCAERNTHIQIHVDVHKCIQAYT